MRLGLGQGWTGTKIGPSTLGWRGLSWDRENSTCRILPLCKIKETSLNRGFFLLQIHVNVGMCVCLELCEDHMQIFFKQISNPSVNQGWTFPNSDGWLCIGKTYWAEQRVVFLTACEPLSVYTIIGFIDTGGLLRLEEYTNMQWNPSSRCTTGSASALLDPEAACVDGRATFAWKWQASINSNLAGQYIKGNSGYSLNLCVFLRLILMSLGV